MKTELTPIEQRAAEEDRKRGLTEEAQKAAEQRLKDYNLKVAGLNALVQRSSINPPTDFDIRRLDLCIDYFQFPQEEVINKQTSETELS